MTDFAERAGCPFCGGALDDNANVCPHCRATGQWRDYASAINFTRSHILIWQANKAVAGQVDQIIDQSLIADRKDAEAAVQEGRPFPPDTGLDAPGACWRCKRAIGRKYAYCNTCGAPVGKDADDARYYGFLLHKLKGAAISQADPAVIEFYRNDVQSRIATIHAQLEHGCLSDEALNRARRSDRSTTPVKIRRSLLDIMLDPRSIHWLLASGGGLLVVGLIIWLASLGVFQNTLVVAACIGAGTLALLAGGSAVVKCSRYQLAGRALTLLACLVMPLNLWFYHAHGLVTLDGHLWLAALVCCALYAASAAVLEDPVFVYVLVAGVAMTGLLLLADLHRLTEVAAPATLLVTLGLIGLHLERVFIEGDGPFSRKRFGMAFFWSGQILLGLGLLLVFSAQMVSAVPLVSTWIGGRSLIVTDQTQRLLAIALVLVGGYACVYSGLVVRRAASYFYSATVFLLWAGILIIHQAHLTAHPPALIGILAITSLLANLLQSFGLSRLPSNASLKLGRPLPWVNLLLAVAPASIGAIAYLRTTPFYLHEIWPYMLNWPFVCALAIAAICSRISVQLNQGQSTRFVGVNLSASAAATLIAAAGLLSLVGVETAVSQALLLMVIPIAYLVSARLNKGRPTEAALTLIANSLSAALIAGVLVSPGVISTFSLDSQIAPLTQGHLHLKLAAFCLEAGAFYLAAAIIAGAGLPLYLGTLLMSGAVWQLLANSTVPGDCYSYCFAAFGVALLIIDRLGFWKRVGNDAVRLAGFRCANALISFALVASSLMAMSRLAVDTTNWSLAANLGITAGIGLLAAAVARSVHGESGLRRWYFCVSIFEAALALFTLQQQAHLNAWQNTELFSVTVGLFMLAIGYSLWYREQDQHSAGASFSLLFGSLLAGVPLLIAAIVNRFGFEISQIDEFSLATVSTMLFVSGFMLRLRAPTLIGGSLLALHLSMLLVAMGMQAELAIGIYFALGGGALFAIGLFLSIYRDRLLNLLQRMKSHEGVFKVLAWR